MAKRFPLQTLLDLAQDSSDAAAAHLGVVNGHDRDMQKRSVRGSLSLSMGLSNHPRNPHRQA